MTQLYSHEGASVAGRGEVNTLMEVAYVLERREISAAPVPSMGEKWPYLWMYSHFQLLTDIPIWSQLEESFPDKGKKIFQYFKNKPTSEVQAVLPLGDETAAALYVILLLMAYFKEKSDALFIQADVS